MVYCISIGYKNVLVKMSLVANHRKTNSQKLKEGGFKKFPHLTIKSRGK